MQYHFSKKNYRKFHSNGKRSRSIRQQVTSITFFNNFFSNKNSFLCRSLFQYYIKQIDSRSPYICLVIDHRKHQNVVKTSVTHSAIASCATLFSSYHILTESVIYLSNRPQVSTCDVARTQKEFVNHSPAARDLHILPVFYRHPACFISLYTIETCGLLLLYKNSEDARFFHGFTGTINHS